MSDGEIDERGLSRRVRTAPSFSSGVTLYYYKSTSVFLTDLQSERIPDPL